MPAPIRFWGRVLSLRPRLVLTKFEGQTEASCPGYVLTIEGTLTEGSAAPVPGVFTVALGPATLQKRELARGDLLRGEAHRVPEALPDVPAELYKVGVLRQIARADTPLPSEPPCTDPLLTPEDVVTAPRRALAQTSLLETSPSPCPRCVYGVVVCVVRLTDPRNYRGGRWSQVPACLGPETCSHFVPREE